MKNPLAYAVFLVLCAIIWYNKLMKARIVKTESSAENVTISRKEYEELVALKAMNQELNQQVQWLLEQMKQANRKQYGASSEKTDPKLAEQLCFLFNEAEVHQDLGGEVQTKVEQVVPAYTRKVRSKKVQDHLPEGIRVEQVIHDLPKEQLECPVCGEQMVEIGRKVTTELVIVRPDMYIREHVYLTYGCGNCQKNGTETPIVETPRENSVIPGGFASPEAIAHLMTEKYVMGTPLYRQEKAWNRRGYGLSRQTMSNWLLKATESYLHPLWEAMHCRLLREDILHADETPLQVLREPGKKATSKSYMWVYATGRETKNAIALYDYQPDRKAVHPRKFLEGFKGYLHTDGYQAYRTVSEDVVIVGCLAHLRRKFETAVKSLPKSADAAHSPAGIGLGYCNKLFDIERELDRLPPEERTIQRQAQAKPVLDAFSCWADTVTALPNSALGKAMVYLRNQLPQVAHYLDDGRLECSNNRAERLNKDFVIDRKNFLFCNTPSGARASAEMFSIIETAKLNDLDPYSYLLYVFRTAKDMDLTDEGTLAALLPWNAPEECRNKKTKGQSNGEDKH